MLYRYLLIYHINVICVGAQICLDVSIKYSMFGFGLG